VSRRAPGPGEELVVGLCILIFIWFVGGLILTADEALPDKPATCTPDVPRESGHSAAGSRRCLPEARTGASSPIARETP